MRYVGRHHKKPVETPKYRALRALNFIRSEIFLGPQNQVEHIEMSKATFTQLRDLTVTPFFDLQDPLGDGSYLGIMMDKKILENNAIEFGRAKIVYFREA